MKILFLDIDGVLNSLDEAKKNGGHWEIYPRFVKILNGILKDTGAHIVLSSAWRHRDDWRETLIKAGVMPDRILSRTGSRSDGIRGSEIRAWIRQHESYPGNSIEKYAILDDESYDIFFDQPLFKCDNNVGLTKAVAKKVIAHLR